MASKHQEIMAECQARKKAAAEKALSKPWANLTADEVRSFADPIGSIESKAAQRKLVRELEIAEKQTALKAAFLQRISEWQNAGAPADEILLFDDFVFADFEIDPFLEHHRLDVVVI